MAARGTYIRRSEIVSPGKGTSSVGDNELSRCAVMEGSATEIPLADDSVDTVHSWDFIHHVDNVPRVLSEIRRVLRPGGRYIAFEPNVLNPSITWYHARRRNEWRLFTQNQFNVTRYLRRHFNVSVHYDNTIISFLNERTQWLWNAVDCFTSLGPLNRLSFRYVIDARLKAVTPNC